MDLNSLHHSAREIFHESLKSVDAAAAVRRAVRLLGARLELVETSFDLAARPGGIYAVAIGKAARPMASALDEIVAEHLTAGVISAPSTSRETQTQASSVSHADASLSDNWLLFEGGHPLPNQASMDASRAAFDLLRRADGEGALVIFLISGGGSALMEWPRDKETTLEELQAAHRALVSCGASINEINAVRRAVSAIKGGGLSRRAPNCDQVSLIISDTNSGEEAIVSSGPTFDSQVDAGEASGIVARHGLEKMLPASILRALRRPAEKPPAPSDRTARAHYVLLDNESAVRAAADAALSRGLSVEVSTNVIEQAVAEGSSLLLSHLLKLSRRAQGRAVCLISGGEFACPVRGPGRGGRNAETALRWAIEMEMLSADAKPQGISHLVALSAGTDGIDGNSPAAGAIADETTIKRARHLNLDAHHFLEESDAYTFFRALHDAIITGPTGTNVRDLRILLAS